MKIGVLSDIHGNYEAFKACLDYMEKEKVDRYILLGDYVGEFPNPEMTFGLIHGLMNRKKCYVIKGNKEEYIEKGIGANHPEWDSYPSTIGMLRYGYDHVSGRDKDFIKHLPITDVVKIEGMPSIRISHGSPWKASFHFDKATDEEIQSIEEDVIIFGHTHEQFTCNRCGKSIYNPGSVGLTINNDCAACCMILHAEYGTWRPEFLEIDYNIQREIDAMERDNLFSIAPYWSIVTLDILRGGRVWHGSVLNYAMSLCEKETGKCEWPKIPEKYMQKAVSDLVFLD
ncbi:MAG: metallophosphoesterase family protein [Lachnospiraceae bacterium]|nr:metallophosphoesterase family protein [Lachnospiraceae bacterium]